MTGLSAEALDKLWHIGQVSAQSQSVELPNGKKGIIIPEGFRLDQVAPTDSQLPENIKSTVRVHDEESFLKYLDRFKNARTQIFAAPGFLHNGSPYFQAAVDYHQPEKPARNDHMLHYTPRYSDQWKLWMGVSAMNQNEFAEFIEENRQDVVKPTAAELLDLARNFKASRKINYDKVFTEKDGNVKLTYEDETEAVGEVSVPDMITVGIPVYFNGPKYSVDFWVRYRLGAGQVNFVLKPDRADVVEMDAFDEMADRIAEHTKVEVYLGRFEKPNERSSLGRYED